MPDEERDLYSEGYRDGRKPVAGSANIREYVKQERLKNVASRLVHERNPEERRYLQGRYDGLRESGLYGD